MVDDGEGTAAAPRVGAELVAVVIGPTAAHAWGAPPTPRVAVVGNGVRERVDPAGALDLVAWIEAQRHPRWVWWSAEGTARPFVSAGLTFARAWDITEAHRLITGGWHADPGVAWAAAHGLPLDSVPAAPSDDLFDVLAGDSGDSPPSTHGMGEADAADNPEPTVRPDGHLRPDAAAGTWQITDERLLAWADTLIACATAQHETAQRISPRLVATIHAESAAAVLCEELRRDGLPVDRPTLTAIVEPMCGPPATRDAPVLALVPGHEHTDLRNPAQVRDMLGSVGIDVPNTRKYTLQAFRDVHPVVPALLEWRKHERIATTYGLRWMQEHIGDDDRLRGGWRASDGAAGRMTAEAGLHNLPAALRPGIAAHDGHVFVRADLGQIEPRVLAVVSGDRALAAATQSDDLYAPVAERLGVDRATAKIAVLAAMYGQRSGAAGQALKGLERAYPVAMRHLDEAYAAGTRGDSLRTYGGRLIVTSRLPTQPQTQPDPRTSDPGFIAARGRFARNAIIQGAAAELFKAWAATVRAATREHGAEIVLCLHDELLVHTPERHADATAQAVGRALTDAARRWSGGAPVRFVSDTSVVHRWSEAEH
ncbi:MAG: DNA polymerase [Dermatophilus congolensis]|nr:DNA polymerase [Dermatophilus congolensis]